MYIASITPLPINVSDRTNWFFLRIDTDEGRHGWGELTLSGGWEPAQLACVERLKPMLLGKEVVEACGSLTVYPHSAGGLVWNSVVSAAEMALTDLRAQEAGKPLHELFGKPLRKTFRLYANVNRMTRDRTPAGFAQSAATRVADGYSAIKIAPFDGVHWSELSEPAIRQRFDNGIAAVHAVREAVGPDIDVMIDCHWRFDESSAKTLLTEVESAKLFWAECLVSERPEHHAELARVREFARSRGTRLCGGERQSGPLGFAPIVKGRLLDVIMPDIKYAGGFAGMLRIAEESHAAGIEFSPHNPTGPVCTLASLHACALAPNFLILERQKENAMYDRVVVGQHPAMKDGAYELPTAPGLGVSVNEAVIAERPYQPLEHEALSDPRLG